MKTKFLLILLLFCAFSYSQVKFNFTDVDVSQVDSFQNREYQAYLAFHTHEIATLEAELSAIHTRMAVPGISKGDLDKLKKQADELRVKLKDSRTELNDLIDMERFKQNNFHAFSFGSSYSNAFFNIIYSENSNKLNALSNSGFSVGDESGSVYTELISGNFKTIRLSFGTSVSNSSADTDAEENTEEAFQRLATNGGNTSLTVEYPLLYWGQDDNQYNLIGRFLGRAAADFEAFGTKTEDFAGCLSAGVDLYADFSTNKKEIRVYGNFSCSAIYGTESYRDNLGIEEKNFTFAKLSAGVIIENKVNISLIFSTLSSEENLRNKNVILGGTIMLK